MDYHLIVDTALFILIWLVQLIIYPVFGYMSAVELKLWHRIYVPRITFVVAPLMIFQFILYIGSFQFELIPIVQILLLIGIWVNTFLQAVPIHGRIFAQEEAQIQPSVQKLLRVNWIRTVLWSILWLMHFFHL